MGILHEISAVNAVSLKLHWTACWKKMPLDFAWEFCWNFCRILFLQIKTFTNSVFVVFPNYLIGGSFQGTLIAYCAQCNAYFVLCAQKKQMRDLWVLHDILGASPYMYGLCGTCIIHGLCGVSVLRSTRWSDGLIPPLSTSLVWIVVWDRRSILWSEARKNDHKNCVIGCDRLDKVS